MKRVTKNSLRAVAALGMNAVGAGAAINPSWFGSGFVIGFKDEELLRFILLTNKHVVKNHREIIVRLTLNDNLTSRDFAVPLYDATGALLYSSHPSNMVDIAAVSLDNVVPDALKSKICYFDSKKECLTLDKMRALDLGEGSTLFALGFPMGMVDVQHNYTICRSGCVAKIESTYQDLDPIDYMGSVEVFPGNSGGPAVVNVTMPEDDKDLTALVGIVHSSISYTENLISIQTKRTRSVMEENSGLTLIHPVDRILDVAEQELKRVELAALKRGAL